MSGLSPGWILAGLIAAILGLYLLAWMALRLVHGAAVRASSFLPGLHKWFQAHSLRIGFARRYPRLYAFGEARLTPASFNGLPLTLMVAAALYAVALLSGLVQDVVRDQQLHELDLAINAFFRPWRFKLLLDIFLWITALGAAPTISMVVVVATAFLWVDRRRPLILPLWVTFIGAQATTWAGKYFVGRARPEFIDAVTASSPSFPSAHSTSSLALYGFLAYLIARDLDHSRGRFEVVFWTTVLIALIGFSRVFLSVHFTTDVASGWLVGTFWLLVGFVLAERRRVGTQKRL